MKRALLVGIDSYDHFSDLSGCASDVRAIQPLFARNEDDSINFSCQSLVTGTDRIGRRGLIEATAALLAPGADVALLYFAGHGLRQESDVVLVTQDGDTSDSGVKMSEVLAKVQESEVREVIILLDCCFAGGAGGVPQLGGDIAAIRSGLAIITASRSDQPAAELGGRGVFSTYLEGALDGGAADVLGRVNLAGVYAYLSESFGPWEQRPVFKANLDRLGDLRSCAAAVPISQLRELRTLFPDPEHEMPLDPSYEPTEEPRHADNEAVFGLLQRGRSAKLIEPVDADHMYFAAMKRTACRLTPLGRHYWRMADQDLL